MRYIPFSVLFILIMPTALLSLIHTVLLSATLYLLSNGEPKTRGPNDLSPVTAISSSNFTLKITTLTDHWDTSFSLKLQNFNHFSLCTTDPAELKTVYRVCPCRHVFDSRLLFSSKGAAVNTGEIFVAVKTCRKFHSERGESHSHSGTFCRSFPLNGTLLVLLL